MRKGQLLTWTSTLIGFGVMIAVIIVVGVSLSLTANKDDALLKLDTYDYMAKQELNQFLNSPTNFNKHNLATQADVIAGYFYDDSLNEQLSKDSRAFFGGGDLFKPPELAKGDANIVLIVIMDDTTIKALREGHEAAKQEFEEDGLLKKIFNFVPNAIDTPEAFFIEFLDTAVSETYNRVDLRLNPEQAIKRIGDDQGFAVAATNIIEPTGETINVVLIRRLQNE